MPSKNYTMTRIHKDYLAKLEKLVSAHPTANSNTKMLHRLIDEALKTGKRGPKPKAPPTPEDLSKPAGLPPV